MPLSLITKITDHTNQKIEKIKKLYSSKYDVATKQLIQKFWLFWEF